MTASTVTKFDTLYKKSSKGKISEWTISVEENDDGHGVITVVRGYTDGAKQTDVKVVKRGKNKGKANETTPFEQALSQAESTRNKQIDKGYTSLDEVDKLYVLPMLAHSYDKRKKYLKLPCIGQPKFDGIRCLAYINKEDRVVLMSRKGKKFPNLDHLLYSVDQILGSLEPEQVYLDGELYSDELTFQEITGICRRETLREGDEEKIKKIKYRVYDVITPEKPDMDFIKRYEGLTKLVKRDRKGNVILTENFQVRTDKEMKKLHDKFVNEGYEGLILRNLEGVYGINKRSNDLLKYKAFQDDEYEIVGYAEGTGKDEGTVIWTCKTKKKQEFNVRPRGTHEERTHWFDNGDKYVGSKLTVRFFELTDDGIPRFPVGISIRDYE